MKTDLQLKADVTAELVWEPAVDATNIGVAVKDGIVTLSGEVETYLQKHAVERAARRVAGVRGIALDLNVKLAPNGMRSDTEIALAALNALRWHSLVPEDRIKVEVEDGWVTLRGDVEWAFESASAEQCVAPLVGVKGVTNNIAIKAHADVTDIARDIADAFARHAQREARHISIEVDGSVVTLRGKVDSLPEHDAAIGTALAAKGVSRVVDKIEVAA
jgi:osmotically-inducible protein OsmY